MWITYEDLTINKVAVLKSLCQFLSLVRNDSELEQVMEATSLENMKRMESDFSWQRSKSFKTWKEDAQFVREGKTRGFVKDEQIKEEWVVAFEKKSEAMLKKFNYLP